MRMSISQIIGEDRRPVGEVILDSVAIMDKLMREAAVPLRAGQPLAPDQLDRLLDATKLANHVAKVAVDAGATQALVLERQRHRAQENEYVTGAILAVVDGLEDHLLALGIDRYHVAALRTWAFETAAARLEDAELPALPPVPVEAVRVVDVDPVDDHDDDARVREEDGGHDRAEATWLRVVDVDDDPSSG